MGTGSSIRALSFILRETKKGVYMRQPQDEAPEMDGEEEQLVGSSDEPACLQRAVVAHFRPASTGHPVTATLVYVERIMGPRKQRVIISVPRSRTR